MLSIDALFKVLKNGGMRFTEDPYTCLIRTKPECCGGMRLCPIMAAFRLLRPEDYNLLVNERHYDALRLNQSAFGYGYQLGLSEDDVIEVIVASDGRHSPDRPNPVRDRLVSEFCESLLPDVPSDARTRTSPELGHSSVPSGEGGESV